MTFGCVFTHTVSYEKKQLLTSFGVWLRNFSLSLSREINKQTKQIKSNKKDTDALFILMSDEREQR